MFVARSLWPLVLTLMRSADTAGGKVLQVAHEHPVAAAAVLGAVAAPIVVPATLGVVGFGHGGVAGGTPVSHTA